MACFYIYANNEFGVTLASWPTKATKMQAATLTGQVLYIMHFFLILKKKTRGRRADRRHSRHRHSVGVGGGQRIWKVRVIIILVLVQLTGG